MKKFIINYSHFNRKENQEGELIIEAETALDALKQYCGSVYEYREFGDGRLCVRDADGRNCVWCIELV